MHNCEVCSDATIATFNHLLEGRGFQLPAGTKYIRSLKAVITIFAIAMVKEKVFPSQCSEASDTAEEQWYVLLASERDQARYVFELSDVHLTASDWTPE